MNRSMIRKSKLPKTLLSIDSTTITLGENRLPWAKSVGLAHFKQNLAFASATILHLELQHLL